MGRRIPTQVHHQLGRLVREGVFTERKWQSAVQLHPPIPLPPKAPAPRTAYDLKPPSSSHISDTLEKSTRSRNMPEEVVYLEDHVRRQFFRDHPFEAFRPVTLTEGEEILDDNAVRGFEWTRLRQRGRNPTPEDAVRYAVNLHQFHDMPLTFAYTRAVSQFRALRAEHFISRRIAAVENQTYGMEYKLSEITLGFTKEVSQLKTWDREAETDASEFASRKRWRSIMANYEDGPSREWTRGQAYVQQWKKGRRPHYVPDVKYANYDQAEEAQFSDDDLPPPTAGFGLPSGPSSDPSSGTSQAAPGNRVGWADRKHTPAPA